MRTQNTNINRKFSYQILWILLLFAFKTAVAQSEYILKITSTDKDSSFLENNIRWQKNIQDSTSIQIELKKTLLQLYEKAYLCASYDSISIKDSLITAFLNTGNQYKWVYLKKGNVNENFLKQAGFLEKWYEDKLFSYTDLSQLIENILNIAENNGYPFAAIKLDSLKISENEISGQLKIKKGRLIRFAGIQIEGDIKLSQRYLENYFGIKDGIIYEKNRILKIKDRIRELPFLKEKKNALVTFKGKKATVVIFPERKKASRFDFLIGILPNTDFSKRLLITGNITMELYSQFGRGERFYTNFERVKPGTQKLEMQASYPYVLDMPFGIDTKFELYKKDSSILTTQFDGGIQYLYRGNNYLKAFWSKSESSLLAIDENSIISGIPLSNQDVSNSAFGLEYNHQNLDYRYNPRSGFSIFVNAGAGIRKILKNNTILKIKEDYYDSLELKSYQYKIRGQISGFLPILKRSTVMAKIQSGYILAKNPVFQNEQFRIGGSKLLRGFDEESIYATQYSVFTLEYRFLLGQNSFMYLFGDYGVLKDFTNTTDISDQPIGFGAGLTFETKAGIFGISYAYGRQLGNPIEFDKGKIHFGYVNYF